MRQTPQSNRVHIAVVGETNAGKSALFNAILGQESAIVSAIAGTTTDPVSKSMELLPYGSVVLIDTAGLNDGTALGQARMRKTMAVLDRADYALYVCDANGADDGAYHKMAAELAERDIPHMVVVTKKDAADAAIVNKKIQTYANAAAVSIYDKNAIQALKAKLAAGLLDHMAANERSLVSGLVPPGGVAVLVVPLDAGAPKGRLILPQVQLLRDCLDNGVRCHVTTPAQLPSALRECARIDMIITDSQAFSEVEAIVPRDMPLTSFSILMARQKCDLEPLIEGTRRIGALEDGDRVLVAEVCTHNQSHEDIGRVKIPATLEKITGKRLLFTFVNGKDYPEDLGQYALIVHCGGCMATPKEIGMRMKKAARHGVPATNYGLVLAYGSGIFTRAVEMVRRAPDGGK